MQFASLAKQAHPPISREAHIAARQRLDLANGDDPVAVSDLIPAHGYSLVMEGYDRFGWPKGHPESPLA